MSHDPNSRRPHRQDTFDLRGQMQTDGTNAHMHHEEEHSIMEDDSADDRGDEDDGDEFMDDDDEGDSSSSLSIPNESIDFDLVYSLHTFVATVEGQANVVKGDSLFLMDDSNSYWWLVRVLKTQEVGYIPAENIETPYERLARLNKHRNVDLAAATPEERTLDPLAYRAHQALLQQQQNPSQPVQLGRRSISFRGASMFHYPPAVWNEDEAEGWEEDDYESYDAGFEMPLNDVDAGEWDDDEDEDAMDWEESRAIPQSIATQQQQAMSMLGQQVQQQQAQPPAQGTRPLTLQQQQLQQQAQQARSQSPYSGQDPRDPNQQQRPLQQQSSMERVQQQGTAPLNRQTSNERMALQQQASNNSLRQQGSRDGLNPGDGRSNSSSPRSVSPGSSGTPNAAGASGPKTFDPEALDSGETKKISVTPSVAREQSAVGASASQGSSSSTANNGPLLPSAILAQQQNENKRVREELEEEARKRRQREGAERSSSQQSNRPDGVKADRKLTKQPVRGAEAQRDRERESRDREKEKEEEKEKKKTGGMFSGLFGKKNKDKDKQSISSNMSESSQGRKGDDDYYAGRKSSMSTSEEGATGSGRNGYSTERPGPSQSSTEPSTANGSQGLGLGVRQIDMKQQAAYQRYMETTAKDVTIQPSYGLQSASTVGMKGAGSSSMKGGQQNYTVGVTQFGEKEKPTSLKPGSGSMSQGGVAGSVGMGGPGSGSGHQRPGSLILTAAGLGFEGGASVPELSVMRVFAGGNLSTEATFKTVLINTSTTANDLVKQAMQRFRVSAGENSSDYYLTVKSSVEGSFTSLQPHEKPLQVFEELIESNAREETLPTIKRSSITSISSVSSNLSMHPAIRRLPMNDFTDDSTVKFYLNRYIAEDEENADRNLTATAANVDGPEGGRHESLMSMGSTTEEGDPFGDRNSTGSSNLSSLAAAADRFTSPTARFAIQVLIYPDDLPDGMVFDPHTEAIVPKNSLKDRTPLSSTASPGIPQTFRRKVFVFPKNTTVAEVIELGLERFGISEGVVDGGDEVEDKNTKRRSATRVRYGLSCLSDGQEKELLPSSKVLDAFSRPPTFRMVDQRRSGDGRRRSADATLLLGTIEDVGTDDPAFILRRAVAYRMNNAPRSRLSAPLDELALSHLQAQRESMTASSEASATKEDDAALLTPRASTGGSLAARPPPAQLSRQEIIAAQRAATRANQKAILSAQANSEHGVDILLPDKATIRSSRIGSANSGGQTVRYSYIEPDGETYDISEIMEEEWSPLAEKPDEKLQQRAPGQAHLHPSAAKGNRGDLLEGALGRQGVSDAGQHQLGEKIDRVLNKIKANATLVGSSGGRGVSAVYSDLAVTPPSRPERAPARAPSRSGTPSGDAVAPRSVGAKPGSASGHRPNQASVTSMEGSDLSAYDSNNSTPNKIIDGTPINPANKPRTLANVDSPNRSIIDEGTEEDHYLPPASTRKRPLLVLKDHDFGLSRMMAVIEMNAAMRGPAPWQVQAQNAGHTPSRRTIRRQQSLLTSDNIVDEVLFGPKMDIEELHPKVREIYEPMSRQLDAMDKQIDELLLGAMRLANRA